MALLLDYLNPFTVFRNYVRIPVEAFVTKQYLDYKGKADRGVNSAKEILLRALIISLFVTAILWISVFMYVVFYYTYMPNIMHVRPVHLQFKSCEEQTGICSFPSAHVQLTKRSRLLMSTQQYRIKLILDMPESPVNKELVKRMKKSRYDCRVQLLESPHNASFKAFVVRVPTQKLEIFMKEDFWPKGVVYRRFRGRVPPTTTGTTSATLNASTRRA